MGWISLIKGLFKNKKNKKNKKVFSLGDIDVDERESYIENLKFEKDIKKNIAMINELYGESFDLCVRRFKMGKKEVECALVYMSGLTDTESLEKILKSLEIKLLEMQEYLKTDNLSHNDIIYRLMSNKFVEEAEDFKAVLKNISLGSSAIFVDGIKNVILCETKGYQIRGIEEPESEVSLRGPRDGFVENIFTNSSLIRQRLRIPHLWIQDMEIGSLSKTNVAVAFIKGLASEELVEEVKSRLSKIDLDGILDSGYIQEMIKDEPLSLFPLIDRTERPDKAVSCLLEGKIVILTNNTPMALIVPVTYNMMLQAPDDYYEPFPIGSLVRLLRHVAFLISVLLPGIYIAVVTFHQELLPIGLLLRIASTREGIPFPIMVESLLMESIFEILREAGLRLPRSIGSAISIVGALVLGEAAISAGLVSPPMVIIVAGTAIASFTTPGYTLATAARILRYGFIILGGSMGLFGIQYGFLLVLMHLCSLRSFGQPYFQPFAPLVWQDLKDSFIRLSRWQMVKRPRLVGGREQRRQEEKQKPKKPFQSNEKEKSE